MAGDIDAAQAWFGAHGLPWFVEGVDDRVAELLSRGRLLPVLVAGGAVGAVAGTVAGRAAADVATGVSVGVLVVLVLVLLYASGPLKVGAMARWAIRSVVKELGLLLPLALRALPLLLLFMTFLFINTEVWQVAGTLPLPRVWAVVLVFATVGTTFLLVRLPEEVRRVEQSVADDGLARACRGTPLERRARELDPPEEDLLHGLLAGESRSGVPGTGSAAVPGARAVAEAGGAQLSRAERANLVLVLLVAQAFQVLLLALSVFAFFILFGVVAISPDVVTTWVGAGHPRPILGIGLDRLPVSAELVNVSLFLSAFAAMYFTVYAVSDAGYRQQFFAHLDTELEQAVGVRTVYRTLLRLRRDARADRPDSAGDQGRW